MLSLLSRSLRPTLQQHPPFWQTGTPHPSESQGLNLPSPTLLRTLPTSPSLLLPTHLFPPRDFRPSTFDLLSRLPSPRLLSPSSSSLYRRRRNPSSSIIPCSLLARFIANHHGFVKRPPGGPLDEGCCESMIAHDHIAKRTIHPPTHLSSTISRHDTPLRPAIEFTT